MQYQSLTQFLPQFNIISFPLLLWKYQPGFLEQNRTEKSLKRKEILKLFKVSRYCWKIRNQSIRKTEGEEKRENH